ncbi:MAG TPA: signal peptidase II [Acidimicrobiales bacterium]|jgi:signal peptidase II|nr:signal peptidase II [Acidimicrobiales bacterium]
MLALAAVVVGTDQITKSWALHQISMTASHPDGRHLLGPLWLTLTYNSGAAFSLGTGITPVLEVVAAVLVAVLFAFSHRASRRASMAVGIGIALLLGGAVSNLADRLFRHIPAHPGAVIDFVDIARVGHHDWWPVFNIADAAITVGAVVLVVAFARSGGRSGRVSRSGGRSGRVSRP